MLAVSKQQVNVMTSLYRYFNNAGELLYVGISINAIYRLGQHKENAEWFGFIDRIEIEKFENLKLALEAEKTAIQGEKPLYNIAHQGAAEEEQNIGDSPSMQCKLAGLAGLAELSRISSVSVQTLINWSRDKPVLFGVVIKGAYLSKTLK